jgi:hypothetical protein
VSNEYFTDEAGAREEQALRDRRIKERILKRIRRLAPFKGEPLIVAEAESGIGPLAAILDPAHAIYADRYQLCLTTESLILVQVPHLLPDVTMRWPTIHNVPLSEVGVVRSEEELGHASLTLRLSQETGIRLLFEPGWTSEARRLLDALRMRSRLAEPEIKRSFIDPTPVIRDEYLLNLKQLRSEYPDEMSLTDRRGFNRAARRLRAKYFGLRGWMVRWTR